ncbi:MAG TPA: hypothetical protein VHF24_07880 [Acidimicrobiales bacterium]|nr:hypothetical protein [Acidimicrobiales bacterium]
MTGNSRETPYAGPEDGLGPVSDARRPRTKAAFLAAYAREGNVTAAAAAAGIKRQTHQSWLEDDDLYRSRFAAACEEATDALEAEARRRALHGVEEDVYHDGRVVGTRRVYSDELLMFLLSRSPSPGSSSQPSGQRLPRPDAYLQAEIDALLRGRPANGRHR